MVITISELCTGGTLTQYLAIHKHIAEPLIKQFFCQIMEGLVQLKQKGIVHRFLSLDSVILCQCRKSEGELTARICNFCLSEKFIRGKSNLLTERCGYPGFMAPEVINEKQYDEKVDIFSAGVILYAMVNGALPFKGKEVNIILENTLRAKVQFRAGLWEFYSDELRQLIIGMTEKNPEKRITIEEVLEQS
eukprot:TRINITY_DN12117_c0_g1_i1.p1 TRINITY_DN12117_c0_g1~~TRINITY_DN12117_c0_g1_i1.p1  ORF type:complete len:191 (-),score=20.21 TRINITY_DN12117_c0_g1_i1:564-1136(-)